MKLRPALFSSLLLLPLASACGDDAPTEASSSETETGTDSTSGDPTVTTTISGTDATADDTTGDPPGDGTSTDDDSTGDASDTRADSTGDDSTGDDSTGDDSTGDDDSTGGAFCGDDEIDEGEDCDGRNLGGADCEALGYAGGGTLSCSDACTFDTSDCVHGGDCCEANGSPSCDDVTCQQIVCAIDGDCCTTEWDGSCADLAEAHCPKCGGAGEGDCCEVNGSQGCEDVTCQQIVCASHPECCSDVWSQTCADAAEASCVVCEGGGDGSCCDANGTPGCDDLTCQQIVCAFDPFCCSDEWDGICGFWGNSFCPVCEDSGGAGDCCEPNDSPGCEDTTCQQIVCASDPFCCNTEWDQLCSDAAKDSCVVCDGGGSGDCCSPNGSAGCDDTTCQQIVCASDPFCCDTEWDQLCANAANDDCAVCGGVGQGDCCASNGSPGCEDVTCQQTVCAVDPFCCNVEWDQLCADRASDECSVCGAAGDGDCCSDNGTPGCEDGACQQVVCASDPFCCSTAWDHICADAADDLCSVCGAGGDGNCCEANGTPGCQDAPCEQLVCATDPFCCSTAWDQFCANTANAECGVCS